MIHARSAHLAILLAIFPPGSALNTHVLRVRSVSSALAEGKLAATITPDEQTYAQQA
ncbi:L-asparaginase [Serratia liquefaciens]|nr:L-asparaginase [Serratia liquefaciens]